MPADRQRLVFVSWVLIASCSQLLLFVVPGLETVVFHLVWVSMSIVYGFQGWSTGRTAVVLIMVTLVTGATLGGFVAQGQLGLGTPQPPVGLIDRMVLPPSLSRPP